MSRHELATGLQRRARVLSLVAVERLDGHQGTEQIAAAMAKGATSNDSASRVGALGIVSKSSATARFALKYSSTS